MKTPGKKEVGEPGLESNLENHVDINKSARVVAFVSLCSVNV